MTLFIYTHFSTFVKNDYEILKNFSKVKGFRYQQGKSFFIHLRSQILLLFWLIQNIHSAKRIYCWFADYHSFLPALFSKIFKKEFFLVLGGYDVTYIPEINYGSFNNPLRGFCARYSMNQATLNLAVSHYVKSQALKYAPNARITVVYNGIDVSYFQRPHKRKRKQIMTVASVSTMQRFQLKGIDLFIEVARSLPEFKFIIIGLKPPALTFLKNLPTNLQIVGEIEQKKLIDYYYQSKVYCQLSLVESFGLSLAEAMLCGCIPVVTKVGAMFEIVDNIGFFLENRNIEDICKKIKEAMESSQEMGKKAKLRIINQFSLSQRKKNIERLLH